MEFLGTWDEQKKKKKKKFTKRVVLPLGFAKRANIVPLSPLSQEKDNFFGCYSAFLSLFPSVSQFALSNR